MDSAIYLHARKFYDICKNIVMNICRHKPVLKKSSRLTDIWLRFSHRLCCKNYSVRVNIALLEHK